jgi:hypothetical protein
MAGSAALLGSLTLIGGAVLGLILAIGLVLLAIFNNRGKNASRIVTWVVGGLFLCCSGLGLMLTLAGSVLGTGSPDDANLPDQSDIQQMLNERLPSWYTPVSTTLAVISFLALMAALILLALPSANGFFKPRPGWQPPMPGAAYPGHPQGPGYPGYPQTPPYPGAVYPGQPVYPGSTYPGHPQPPSPAEPSNGPATGPTGDEQGGRQGPTPPPGS